MEFLYRLPCGPCHKMFRWRDLPPLRRRSIRNSNENLSLTESVVTVHTPLIFHHIIFLSRSICIFCIRCFMLNLTRLSLIICGTHTIADVGGSRRTSHRVFRKVEGSTGLKNKLREHIQTVLPYFKIMHTGFYKINMRYIIFAK